MTPLKILVFTASLLVLSLTAEAQTRGVLLLAHGGAPEWNAQVIELAKKVDRVHPTEVAFGMATRRTLQEAADALAARGANEIVAVPLFVSSWSSVVTSSAFLLRQRDDAPADLEIFARMDHGAGADHSAHGGAAPVDGRTPITATIPVVAMTDALNDHAIVADILATRALSISKQPRNESVILVAHGPVPDDDNQKWLADMRRLSDLVAAAVPFASIDTLTLRDDAPKPIRDAATTELRSLVETRIAAGRDILIVPLLLSFGGIERGLAERLAGLPYKMPSAALLPDDRLADWVLDRVAAVPAPAR